MMLKSRQPNQDEVDLAEAFEVLRKYKMKLNPSKCAFRVTLRMFLGFMVHQQDEANHDKIRAMLEMNLPKNLKQLQSLNGRIAVLNIFVVNVSLS